MEVAAFHPPPAR